MLEWFAKRGIDETAVLRLLNKKRVDDITGDDLVAAKGMCTSLAEGNTTIDELLGSVTKADDPSQEEKIEARLRKTKPDAEAKDAQPEPADATTARDLDTLRRKVLGMWANLPVDKRMVVVNNVKGLDGLTVNDTLKKTTDIGLLTAVLETIPGA